MNEKLRYPLQRATLRHVPGRLNPADPTRQVDGALAGDPTHARFGGQSHSFPDDLVALSGHS